MSSSCLVTKLSHYVDLTDQEKDLLAVLEKSEQPVVAGQEIYAGGDSMERLFVVKEGWLYSYANLHDGGRHIARIHHPGDIIGFPNLALTHHAINLRAVTKGCLCPFPKRGLDEVIQQSPKLTALFLTLSAREQVVLIDVIRAASHSRPRETLAYFLCDLIARLRITNSTMTDTIRMPLNQTEIGDIFGVTNVTVSRTLAAMESEQLIARSAGSVRLLQEDALKRMSDFYDRYAEMDTSWFPKSQA